MVHIEDVLLWSLAQKGKPYIFGAEAKATDPNPSAFDCSELVEWSCARAGVTPRVPDGAYYQREHCRKSGMGIPLGQGLRTRGALLFVGDGTGVGRDAITHVAWSLGDGTTIEARGAKWGVGTWPSTNRFDFAALIPGVDYSPGHGRLDPQEDWMGDPYNRAEVVGPLDKINYLVDGMSQTMAYLVQKVGADDVDEEQIANLVIAGLRPEAIAEAVVNALPKDQAAKVADELAKRLQG